MNSAPYIFCRILTHSSLYCAVRGKAPVGESRNLRSSGKRPLTTKEADRCEVLARKRHSSRVRSSISEPIVISDDEGEDQDEPECPSGFPDPASIGGYGWKPPVDLDGPLPNVRPLAMIDPDQGSTDPDPSTVTGVLQRLENALKQVISILGVRWGLYADFHPFLVNCLGEIRRVGGARLAMRCDRKLVYWKSLALRTEKLAFSDLCNEVTRLLGEARVRIMREREARAQRIIEQEAIVATLRERQHRLQRAMDGQIPFAARTGVETTLEDLKRESTDVYRAFSKAMQILDKLQYEQEVSADAPFEERFEVEAEAQARANRAKEIANLKAALESFTVLDCAE